MSFPRMSTPNPWVNHHVPRVPMKIVVFAQFSVTPTSYELFEVPHPIHALVPLKATPAIVAGDVGEAKPQIWGLDQVG